MWNSNELNQFRLIGIRLAEMIWGCCLVWFNGVDWLCIVSLSYGLFLQNKYTGPLVHCVVNCCMNDVFHSLVWLPILMRSSMWNTASLKHWVEQKNCLFNIGIRFVTRVGFVLGASCLFLLTDILHILLTKLHSSSPVKTSFFCFVCGCSV